MKQLFAHHGRALIIGTSLAFILAMVPVGIELFRYLEHPVFGRMSPISPESLTSVLSPLTPTSVPTPKLNIDQILQWSRFPDTSTMRQLPQQETTQILLLGDVMLGRAVNYNMQRKQDDTLPFHQIADVSKTADITVANLEAPIVTNCPLTAEGIQLCTGPNAINSLTFAGIDLVQLANNHIWDYGEVGATNTKAWLELNGLEHFGLQKAAIKEVRGTKFGFLGYNQIYPTPEQVSHADAAILQSEISGLRQEVDVVIVGFHWGQEYQTRPNTEQQTLAKAAIDAGADVVWGQHPHWVQGMELYQSKPIFYSLGNFVFDQMHSAETREGLAVELNFWKNNLIEVKLKPIFMSDFAQPAWQPVGVGNSTLGKVERLSQELIVKY